MENAGRIYDTIRTGTLHWARRWFGSPGETVMIYVFLLPDLVRLLINLLSDHRVFLLDKIFVAGVLVYVISPVDFFPEFLVGPFGLVEDLFLVLMILYRLMSNPYNQVAIEEHWQGDPKLLARLQRGFQYIKVLMMKRR